MDFYLYLRISSFIWQNVVYLIIYGRYDGQFVDDTASLLFEDTNFRGLSKNDTFEYSLIRGQWSYECNTSLEIAILSMNIKFLDQPTKKIYRMLYSTSDFLASAEVVAFIISRQEQKIIYKMSFFHSYDKHFYSVWKRTGLQVVPVLEMIHDSHQSRFQKALSPKCFILTSAATMLDTRGSSILFET